MTSQLQTFTSGDANAPQLTGESGSLIGLLDAVLVNGYGSKSGLGWLKPIANDSNLGCWQQPSGSGMTLFVNDAAPTGSANGGTREAWGVGYESLVGLTGSVTGTGYGQFPLSSQVVAAMANNGAVVIRKSNTQNTITRNWMMFGDEYTFYLFVDWNSNGNYSAYFFGDIFSLSISPDYYKCIIMGRMHSSQVQTSNVDAGDLLCMPSLTTWPCTFMPRTFGGNGFGIIVNKVGDMGKGTLNINRIIGGGGISNNTGGCEMAGILPVSNPSDNSLYLSPIWIAEASFSALRGRLRGIFHLCHPVTNFGDGQIISGANEYAGKTFIIIKQGPSSGMWVVEISATVETNDLP